MSEATALDPSELIILPAEEAPSGATFSGSRMLFRNVADVLGVNLTEQEDRDWGALLGGAYLVDHLLDIEKVDITPHLNSVISGYGIPSVHQNTQVRFRNYMLRQSEARYDDIMQKLDTVSSMANRQAQAKRVDDVIDVRLEEAELFAYLLSLPIQSMPDAQQRVRMNQWLRGWSRTGYLFDTLQDLRLDYDNGDSGVRPTVAAHAAVAAATAKEAASAARKTPLRLLGRCAVVGFNYGVRNKKPDMNNLQRP